MAFERNKTGDTDFKIKNRNSTFVQFLIFFPRICCHRPLTPRPVDAVAAISTLYELMKRSNKHGHFRFLSAIT